MKKEQKKKLFREFLATNHVLIADKNAASRRRLMKVILDMGGKQGQVHLSSQFGEAVATLESKSPKLVLSDFALNGGSGFDLFSKYKSMKPDTKDITCILITSNISQSAVAKAAEEDVDSFIIKPYTLTSLEASLTKAVINKLHPNEYVKTIEKGKEQLLQGNYEEAASIFEQATELDKKPSLALFYHGQATYFMQKTEAANNDYKEGLKYNSIHFKCQLGLFDLFQNEKKYAEAYDVIRNISKYFPASPQRLKEVIKLAVITQNYKDMGDYYDIFKGLEERTDDVVTYICAGMYIFGKYSLINKNQSAAKETFEKVGISCAGATKFLRAMITELHKHKLHSDAQKLLPRFPSTAMEEEDYMVSAFLAQSGDSTNPVKITQGIELINKGFKDFESMMLLIDTLCKEDKLDKASDYLFDVHKIWPDRKKEASFPALSKKEDNRTVDGNDAKVDNKVA